MKKIVFIALFLVGNFAGWSQAPHLFENEYPVVATENPTIRALMDSVSLDSIEAIIKHLSSYQNRRCDSRHIYDVQDWLVACYNSLDGIDTVVLHDFKINKEGFPSETADNILAIQWGTKTPDEYVICGAHYDSWNNDGTDPDTIRSPGADDNATGVAGIWETARLLSRYRFDRTIIYANWCAEEIGLLGSEAYAKNCAEQGLNIVGYFNLDMTGYLKEDEEIHIHLMYTTQDSLIAQYVFNLSHVYFPNMPIEQNWIMWGDSDYSSFNRVGYPAVHPFEDVNNSSPFIHSRQDVLGLSVNNLAQSKRFTELTLGLVSTLAGLNHENVNETNETTLVAVYPNPIHDVVNIVSDDGVQQVEVYNLLGQMIEAKDMQGKSHCILDTSFCESGIYILVITTEKGRITRRFMVD